MANLTALEVASRYSAAISDGDNDQMTSLRSADFVMDFVHTPSMHIDSDYYADDNRIEVVGERGVVFINRWTAKTIDLPALLMFRDGQTTPIPVERVQWSEAFVDCTLHLIDVLTGQQMTPRLDGKSGRAILQLMQAVQISAREQRQVQVDEVQTIGP